VIVVGVRVTVAVGAGGGGGSTTVRVAVAVVVPPVLVAVSVYVVVAAGLTGRVPDAPTSPMPGSMRTEVAPVVVHVSVADSPCAIDGGDTPIVAVGGGSTTVSTVDDVTDAVVLVAVIVYVAVAAGLTVNEPVAATTPIPWLIVTVVAFVVAQESVADCPWVIDVGETPIVAVGGGGVTVSVVVAVADPFALLAVSV
jgi:hypothetical protein